MVLVAIVKGAVARQGGGGCCGCIASTVKQQHASLWLPQARMRAMSSFAAAPSSKPVRLQPSRRTSSAFVRQAAATPSVRALYASPLVLGSVGASRNLSLWPFGRGAPESEIRPPASDSISATTATDTTASLTQDEALLTSATSPSDPLAAADVSTASAQEAIEHASEQVQTLAEMGQLSGWINVRAAQTVLDWTVEATGLPWWVTIAAITLSVRVLVLPLVLKGQKNAIRLGDIQPQMQGLMKDIQYAKSNGDQALMAQSASAVQKLMKDNDCHPLRSFIVPIVQAPLFMTFFFALRGLAEHGLPSMKTGGMLWFTDLTLADPYCILPILSSASMLLVLETGAEMGGGGSVQSTAQAKIMRNVFRVLCVVTIPIIWNFPAAVFCYWVTNGTISLLQLWMLNVPAVRKTLNLPPRKPKEPKVKAAPTLRDDKPMGFWDSVKAGTASQTALKPVQVLRGNKNEVPPVLRGSQFAEQGELEASRERALKKLAEDSAPTVPPPSPSPSQQQQQQPQATQAQSPMPDSQQKARTRTAGPSVSLQDAHAAQKKAPKTEEKRQSQLPKAAQPKTPSQPKAPQPKKTSQPKRAAVRK